MGLLDPEKLRVADHILTGGLLGRFLDGGAPVRKALLGYARNPGLLGSELTHFPANAKEQIVGDGMNQALNWMTTTPTLALTFGGIGAKTANHDALKIAEKMEQLGDDAKKIWQETGWFRAPWDKKWRFEIDDSNAKAVSGKTLLKKDRKELFDEEGIPYEYRTKLPDAIKHKELYEAYPNIQRDRAYAMRSAYGADADYSGGAFRFDPALTADDLRNVGLHETQHRIQDLEGFARGGYADPGYRGLIDAFDPNYRNMAGEAEARAVQRRLNYTPTQRRAIIPLDDFDVPIDELITRFR
jgi:hypothetical protein